MNRAKMTHEKETRGDVPPRIYQLVRMAVALGTAGLGLATLTLTLCLSHLHG